MSKRIKVLHVLASLNRGGAETLVINLLREVNPLKVQFDFLLSIKDGDYEKEALQLGATLHFTPHLREIGPFKLSKRLDEFFKVNKYDIIHCHIGESSVIYLKMAKKNKIRVRIVHAHSVSNSNFFLIKLYKKYLRLKINDLSTHRFSCSEAAGERLFGNKKYSIKKNVLSTDRFSAVDKQVVQNLKKEFSFNEKNLIIGHVGRFEEVKNHSFLIDLFKEIHKKHPLSKLLLVGVGPLQQEMKNKVILNNLENSVTFAGVQNEMPEIYSLLDVFVFTSLFESFGNVLIEAQSIGIPCLVPNHITNEADLGIGLFYKEPLDRGVLIWAKKSIELFNKKKKGPFIEQLKNNGFDATIEGELLTNFYIKTLNNEVK